MFKRKYVYRFYAPNGYKLYETGRMAVADFFCWKTGLKYVVEKAGRF